MSKTWFWNTAREGRVCLFEGRDGCLDIRKARADDNEEMCFTGDQPKSLFATILAQAKPMRCQNFVLFAKGDHNGRGDRVDCEFTTEDPKTGKVYDYAYSPKQMEDFGMKGAVIKAKGTRFGPAPLLCAFQTEAAKKPASTMTRVDVEENRGGNIKPDSREALKKPVQKPRRVNVEE